MFDFHCDGMSHRTLFRILGLQTLVIDVVCVVHKKSPQTRFSVGSLSVIALLCLYRSVLSGVELFWFCLFWGFLAQLHFV